MRLKTGVIGLWLLLSTFLLCAHAWAVTLSFNPSASSISTGEAFNVDVVISGMQNDDLGTFSLDVNFNENVLVYDSYTLGSELGNIDLFEADDWSFGYLGGGILNIAEISWLWDLSLQPDQFTLATISFSATSDGSSSLTFSNPILGDYFGDPLQQVSLNPGSVSATAPVPEPATLLLLGSGLIGLAGAKRKLKK